MASAGKNESKQLAEARRYVRAAQKRFDRAHGLSEDVHRRIQDRLNEIRHLIEEGEADQADEEIAQFKPWFDEKLEGKEKSVVREYAESIGLAVLFALFLRGFVIEAFKIPTSSMVPTLLVGDHLFVNKFIYGIRIPFTETFLTRFSEPQKGEVVVFEFPREEARKHLAKQPSSQRECIDSGSLTEQKDFIKRIIGVAGDKVELRDNQVIINDEPVERSFLRKETTGDFLYPHRMAEVEELNGHKYTVHYSGADENFGPITVAPGNVFVMGDNRDNSSDGRCWGQVPVDNIKGRAMIIWWSIADEIRWERIGQVIH